MYNHKFGFHINGINKPVAEALTRLKPAVVKTLHHDVNFWRRVRQIYPQTFIIGRLYDPRQQFDDDPARRGREFAERILREEVNQFEVRGRPIYDAWESFNEIMPESSPDDLQKRYDTFQVAFAEKMKAEGFDAIGMNFATGNLLGQHLLKNFRGTLETHKYLGFHEYDWPTMDRLHKVGLADNNGGMWLCLRYRRIMEEVRKEFPDKHTVIITECGMTQGVQGGPDVGPWDRNRPISPDDYWKTLQWYNSELMKDDYAIAACLFVVGAISPWETFEHLGPIMDRLADFQQELPDKPKVTITTTPATPKDTETPTTTVTAQTVTPPDPEPASPQTTPTNTSVTPPPAENVSITFPKFVADYASHYVLFPQGTKEWWYVAARPYLNHFGATRGEKVQDALFLRGTQGHTITCINSEPESLELIRKHNPAAKLDIIKAASPDELAETLNKRVKQNKPF